MDKTLGLNLFQTSSTPIAVPGTRVELSNGDIYRYIKAGASGISAGKMQLAPAQVANHVNQTGSAVVGAVGARQVTLNVGATAVTADQYKDGLLVINDATGEGYTYRISGNAALASSGSGKFDLLDPIQVALVASTSEYTLVANSFNGVVEAASSVRKAAGVPAVSLTAAYYGWAKTKGAASVLIGTAATSGARLMCDGSTAGAVTDNSDVTTVQTEVIVGSASYGAGVSTEYNVIELFID